MNKQLITIVASVVLALGGGGVYVAAQASQEATITGSIRVQRGTRLFRDLASLAQVSEQDAVAAAQQALGITSAPNEVELEVENGYLVWEVEFVEQEVVVDAGNGEVLLIEAGEAEGADNGGDEPEDDTDTD